MEYRELGQSGLKIPVLSFGTATFGGTTSTAKAWGSTQVAEAKRLVDICIDAGLNHFDTADVYSAGKSEEILGAAIDGRRDRVIVSTKTGFPNHAGAKEFGASREHLTRSCEASLKRLHTDYIDIYHLHGFDAVTPVEETLETLNSLVRSGKVRQIACSNFSGWHLMKSLSIAEREKWPRYIAHQAYYSLVGRDLEWELMPLCLDQKVSTLVWSPLAGGALTGKIRRGKSAPSTSRISQVNSIPYDQELLFRVVDVIDDVANEIGKTASQVALNWLLQRPTVASLIIGARNEDQLKSNLQSIGWKLCPEHMQRLNAASELTPTYPYWHQRQFEMLMPKTV
jgi:aryl-alcohol dehydrogenase-like predicted oxidoreductase